MARRKISRVSKINTRTCKRRSKTCKRGKRKTCYAPHDPLYSQLRKAGLKPSIIRV